MNQGPVVLLVEDERDIRSFLRAALTSNGMHVLEATGAEEGLSIAVESHPTIILLDLGLPDGDGVDVTRRLRAWSSVPIIVISARGREADKVEVLDAGADDYLTKPFGVNELLARMRVAMRRTEGMLPAQPVVEIGPLRVDLANRLVRVSEKAVHLTPLEYSLLVTLIKNRGKVLTHNRILKEVWGDEAPREHHYVRVYMAQLRQKIELNPAQPKLIITEPGVGYRLREPTLAP